MKKLFIVTLIFFIQSFSSYGEINGKSIYCIKTKEIYKFSTKDWREFKVTTDNVSTNHFVLVFKNDLLYETKVYKNVGKDGYVIIDDEVEKTPKEYWSSNLFIEWKIEVFKQKFHTYNINRETLELIEDFPKEDEIKRVFQCKIGKKRNLFKKLKERKRTFEKQQKKEQINNKI